MLYWLRDMRYIRLAMPELYEAYGSHTSKLAKLRTKWRNKGQMPEASVNIGPDATTKFLSQQVDRWIVSG